MNDRKRKVASRIGKDSFAGMILSLGLAASGASNAGQLFADGFESGDVSHVENGVKWTGGAYTSVINTFARTGSRSLRFAFQAGSDSWAEARFSLGADYSDVTVEWYAYYPNGVDGKGPKYVHRNNPSQGDNNKLIRLWKGDPSDGSDGYGKFTVKVGASTDISSSVVGGESAYFEYGTDAQGVGQGGSTGSGAGATVDPLITDAFRGRWVNFKFHVKAAGPSNNDGVVELWRDGAIAFQSNRIPMYPKNGVGNGFNFGYLLGWANSGFAETTFVYVDDVKISTGATVAIVPKAPANLTAN